MRQWAREKADGNPAKLPVIREAKAEVRTHFGDAPGAGLGTDAITTTLRELKNEMTASRGVPGAHRALERAEYISRLMLEAGIAELVIDATGDVHVFRKL